MKSQRINPRGRSPEEILEEYLMLGYDAELDGDEVVVYYGVKSKEKKIRRTHSDKWTKRERNFGYTRGQG